MGAATAVFAVGSFAGSFSLGLAGFGNAVMIIFVWQLAVLLGVIPAGSEYANVKTCVFLSTIMSMSTLPVATVCGRVWTAFVPGEGERRPGRAGGPPPAGLAAALAGLTDITRLLLVLLVTAALGSLPGSVLGRDVNKVVVSAVSGGVLLGIVVFQVLHRRCRSAFPRLALAPEREGEPAADAELGLKPGKGAAAPPGGGDEADDGDEAGALDSDAAALLIEDGAAAAAAAARRRGGGDGPTTSGGAGDITEVTRGVLVAAGVAGLASGILGGMTALRGPPTMVLFSTYTFKPAHTRAIGTCMGLVNVSFRMVFYAVEGQYRADQALIYIATALSGIGGLAMGMRLHDTVKRPQFLQKVFQGLNAVSGIVLLLSVAVGA